MPAEHTAAKKSSPELLTGYGCRLTHTSVPRGTSAGDSAPTDKYKPAGRGGRLLKHTAATALMDEPSGRRNRTSAPVCIAPPALGSAGASSSSTPHDVNDSDTTNASCSGGRVSYSGKIVGPFPLPVISCQQPCCHTTIVLREGLPAASAATIALDSRVHPMLGITSGVNQVGGT